MILITAYERARILCRCDEQCYDAQHDVCGCICNGRNHGVGVDEAVRLTQEYASFIAEEVIERYPDATGLAFHYETTMGRFTFECTRQVHFQPERPPLTHNKKP